MTIAARYLVLAPFKSYGKLLEKGTVVPVEQIRYPVLKTREGKIIPAVSSSLDDSGVPSRSAGAPAESGAKSLKIHFNVK